MIGERASAEGPTQDSLPVAAILDLCDRVLNEIGRRRHLFGWLRPNNGAPGEWLAVDAYYPGNRLVVVCRDEPGEHDQLFGELVPAHGLRLLRFAPGAVSGNPEGALRELIAALGPPPVRATGLIAGDEPHKERERPVARAAAAVLAPPDRPQVRRRRMTPLEPQAARHAEAVGLVVGIALVAVVVAEMYLDVTKVLGGGGRLVIAFGIALDACARALGAVAASHTDNESWAWACVLGGSPAVAGFALFQQDGPVVGEPGPLAGLVALLALSAIALGLVILAL